MGLAWLDLRCFSENSVNSVDNAMTLSRRAKVWIRLSNRRHLIDNELIATRTNKKTKKLLVAFYY